MSDNPTKDYNDYIRANLPEGMEYNTGVDRYQVNNHSFFKYKNANWYYEYIAKFSDSPPTPPAQEAQVLAFSPTTDVIGFSDGKILGWT